MSIPVQKNEIVEAEVVGLTHEGEGVGRVNGFTLFIQGALPGEVVRAKVLKVKKTYGYAKLLEHVSVSPDRIEAPCPIYAQCGGCQLQHMDYAAQLRWKRQHVVDNLERIGKLRVAGSGSGSGMMGDSNGLEGISAEGSQAEKVSGDRRRVDKGNDVRRTEKENDDCRYVEGIVVHPTIGMDEPWRYRNKAQVPIGMAMAELDRGAGGAGLMDGGKRWGSSVRASGAGANANGGASVDKEAIVDANARAGGEGRLVGGFYARGSHRIIDMDACLIQHERNDDAVREVKRIGSELGIRAYDEASGRGLLRHVVVRSGFVSGETMVVLVTNGSKLPQAEHWVEGIRAALPDVKSIVQNVNTKKTNVIFGNETKVLWGSEVIYDELDGIRFAISARSFYQVNPEQTVALYRTAVEYAGLTGKEKVIDAYCGIGTISLFLARQAGKVYGVEIVPEAIEDAKRNAVLNGIDNAEFEAGAAEVVIPRWREEGIVADVIVVDPPRKGCDPELLDTILKMQPERVVYVSCNPSTLARDLRVLEDGGYRTVEVQPVDMFPWTVHVECVVGICRWD